MVANMSDDDIWRLNRGGHDPHKVYAAYAAAVKHKGQPTVILAKTVKGYGMGAVGRGQEHHAPAEEDAASRRSRQFRDRFNIPIPDDKLDEVPFYQPAEDSPGDEVPEGARAQRWAARCRSAAARAPALEVPKLEAFKALLKATGEGARSPPRWRSCACSPRSCATRRIGKRVVPIVPDESRTFGMEGMFRQLGIYSQVGQLYKPEDADQLMYYKEDKNGQILQEGINEAGAMCSWIAAATSYSTNDLPMIPFYIYYSMFGFQRVGDLAWAAGDMRARGFLLGGTAGRTTLNGEGLQHEDGHSHLLAVDDPELHLLRPDVRLRGRGDHPGRHAAHGRGAGGRLLLHHPDERELRAPGHAARARGGDPQGHVPALRRRRAPGKKAPRVQLLGSGTILREVIAGGGAAREGLRRGRRHLELPELQRAAPRRHRGRALEPAASRSEKPRASYVEQCLEGHPGPGDRRDRLHARVRRPDPRVRAARATACSAPTASAAATRARTCAASSRWTATTSRSPR